MNLRDKKGQALVELAILLPLLFFILFGITEFGRALYIKNTLTNAAREGARRASISPTDPTADPTLTDLRGKIGDVCSFPIVQGDIIITSAPMPPQHGVSTITVSVPYDFKFMYDLVGLKNITLVGRASMFYE